MQRSEIIQAVHAATAEVFSTMLGVEVELAPVHADRSNPSIVEGLMAFVGIGGPWWEAV